MMAKLGAPPKAVARVIERAISSRSPRPRYKVGASARFMIGLHSVLPTRMWDVFLRSQYPRPGKASGP
jgi:hypothetical protein